jgi:hypothetical protein
VRAAPRRDGRSPRARAARPIAPDRVALGIKPEERVTIDLDRLSRCVMVNRNRGG